MVAEAERIVREEYGRELPPVEGEPIRIRERGPLGFGTIARTVVTRYPRRTVLGLSLFIGQAFLYNAVTFGYAVILTKYFAVPEGDTGYYFAVIAVGNFLGPLLLGGLFDSVGRKPMIMRHLHRLRCAAVRHRAALPARLAVRRHHDRLLDGRPVPGLHAAPAPPT